ncbi:MAG: sugar transferase [Alphaproteobacteria bacterium]|nr:sugar transferase [Alphaproteobacteria bacterium]
MPDVIQQIDWAGQSTAEELNGVSISSAPASFYEGALRIRQSAAKRVLDFIGAAIGSLVLLPFLVLIALAIAAESRGPILFRQRRSGRDGKIFVIYKFRTMHVLEDGNDIVQATRNDGRTTMVGRFLRRSSIDELPQLLNVLKGEMSLVGPRPHAVAHDQYYSQTVPAYDLRFFSKPGITGLAQVRGFRGEVRDIHHMEERIACDLEYIESWSLAMDLRILFLTAVSAPFHSTAY